MATAQTNADDAAAPARRPATGVGEEKNRRDLVTMSDTSLAGVHAKFIEEATGELAKTASEAASDVPVTGMLDEAAAQRIRGLNQQVLARASTAGRGAVDGYEKALHDMADFETKIAGSTQLDWLQAVARSHATFVTDLASMYADAIKGGLSG